MHAEHAVDFGSKKPSIQSSRSSSAVRLYIELLQLSIIVVVLPPRSGLNSPDVPCSAHLVVCVDVFATTTTAVLRYVACEWSTTSTEL